MLGDKSSLEEEENGECSQERAGDQGGEQGCGTTTFASAPGTEAELRCH